MRVFADTHYFIALLNLRDKAHRAASEWEPTAGLTEMITTSWVILELADAMSAAAERKLAAELIEQLRADAKVRIVPLSEEMLWRGFDLYRKREDKEWSFTDCVSFIVMQDREITRALTYDHHFEQVGFEALLRREPS